MITTFCQSEIKSSLFLKHSFYRDQCELLQMDKSNKDNGDRQNYGAVMELSLVSVIFGCSLVVCLVVVCDVQTYI